MKRYIQAKYVNATPMTVGEYNTLCGLTLAEGADAGELGYLVENLDGRAPNNPAFEGFITWVPKLVFELGYKEV